jgi:acyl carrier protein
MSGSSQDKLKTEIRQLIVDSLKLEGIAPESIDVDEPLFDGPLGLDSIDALEIGIALRKRYGIVIESATEEVKSHFQNVRNLAAFVGSKRQI